MSGIPISAIKEHSENRYKTLEQCGYSSELIELMRFDEKYKLYPCMPIYDLLIDAINVIFVNSEKINKNVFFRLLSGLVGIESEDIYGRTNSQEFEELVSERIMQVVIEEFETLYYFNDDEIFREVIFELCTLFDLDFEEYGFKSI